MSDFEDKNHEEIEDTPTLEEQQKIEEIQIATFVPPVKKDEPKPVSVWSIFGSIFTGGGDPSVVAAASGTQSAVQKLEIAKLLYLEKSVIINNISGINAYIMLSPAPIKTVGSVGVSAGASGVEASIDISFENKGDYKVQKLTISNNTSSKCELDNTKFYCTLFFNVDGQWKKSWDNRRFNGRKYNINILEKHVEAALKKEDIPDF